MADRWRRVRLEEALTLTVDRVPVEAGRTYDLAGVYGFGRGLFRRDPLEAERTSYKHLNVLHTDRFVMSKLKAWEGAVTVIDPAFEGAVLSPEFPTYDVNAELLLPGYLRLLTTHRPFWDLLATKSTGMGGRKERVHQTRMLEIEVALPPVAEQRRIIDLVGAAEYAATTAMKSAEATGTLADALIEAGLAGSQRSAPLSDLILGIEAGKSPPAEDRPPKPGELAVLKVSAVRPGYFDPAEAKVIRSAEIFPDHAVLRSGDLLITRANTRDLVGSVCRVDHAPTGYFLCDKTLRLVPDDAVASPDYLLLALQSRGARRQIEDAATGTSASMKNISQASIRSLRLPVVDRPDQELWTSAILEAKAAARTAERFSAELSVLRSALLSSLLSEEHEISDAYDELLERAS